MRVACGLGESELMGQQLGLGPQEGHVACKGVRTAKAAAAPGRTPKKKKKVKRVTRPRPPDLEAADVDKARTPLLCSMAPSLSAPSALLRDCSLCALVRRDGQCVGPAFVCNLGNVSGAG